MAVAFDAYTANNGTGNLSFTHTPVGTPKGIILLCDGDDTTDEFSSATYGGVAMTEVSGSPNVLTTGEGGNVSCFFLGSGIPTGAQTVAVTVIGTGTKQVGVFSVTASADTEVVDSDGTINSTSQADPSVTLSLSGRSSFCAIGFFSGQGAVTGTTPFTSWTSRTEFDFGSDVCGIYSYDTIGTADVSAGWTQTADDACAIAIAISEVANTISHDADSNSGYQAASSGYNWNHTCAGSNRYLSVGIGMLSLAQTVTAMTYNSVAMTFLGSQNSVTGAARIELWGLIAPATGTNSIAVTLSGSIASAGVASSYTNVHQTSPTEGFNSAQATNVGAADATVNVTTVADNDWCVDIVATDDTAITVGAGQTSAGNVTGLGGSAAMSYEGPKTPAGSVTMSWTNVAALATWSIGSIALRNIAASTLGGTSSKFALLGVG